MTPATMFLYHPADNLEQDWTDINLQLELVELIIGCHDGQDFPTARQGIVVTLRAHLHAKPIRDIETNGTPKAV